MPALPVSNAPKGKQNAVAFGADCPQSVSPFREAGILAGPPPGGTDQSEDCFFLSTSSGATALVTNAPACEWHDRPGGAYNVLGNITGCGTGAGSFQCLQTILFDTFSPLALTTYHAPGSALPPWAICVGAPGSTNSPSRRSSVETSSSNRNEGNFMVGTD
ncbi:hypothetical protein C8R47DRAFT_1320950 [Mycena vitilis]|nr:hypothetical protein C8R47DRAFT_1320950 [Mycena vitilis]